MLSRLDAVTYALAIAGQYARRDAVDFARRSNPQEFLHPEAEFGNPRLQLTRTKLEWCWQKYRDPSEAVSIALLSKATGVRKCTLIEYMRDYYQDEYETISARRSVSGDLFLKHYNAIRQAHSESRI